MQRIDTPIRCIIMTPREAELTRENAELHDLIAELRQTIETQQATIDRLLRQHFGRSSERDTGPTLFDGINDNELSINDSEVSTIDNELTPTDTEVSPKKRKGHGRRKPPTNLPIERVEIDLPEHEKPCPCCHKPRIRIGTGEPSRRFDFKPAVYFIRVTVRIAYACRECEQAGDGTQFQRPELPPEPIPRGSATAGLLAHVIVAKFVDHLPLHRQTSILGRHGFDVADSTLCGWMRQAAKLLQPLYDLMLGRVKQSRFIFIDDTPVTLLHPRRSATAWVVLGDAANRFTLFTLTPGRHQEYPLKPGSGITRVSSIAMPIPATTHCMHGGTRHIGCWMHVRRNFFDVRKQEPKACEALAFIRGLYDIEAKAKKDKLTDTALSQLRQREAKPILDRFSDWLMEQQRQSLPASGFGQAVSYAINQWPTLIRYVDDGALSPDNGASERAIHPLALGRNNWLFIGGDMGLSSASVLLSLCASAKQHNLNPWEYLKDVLTRACQPGAELKHLLPDCWQPQA